MAEIDGRKKTILHAIIVEYVLTAEPVGSESLVAKYPLASSLRPSVTKWRSCSISV